MKIGSQTVRHTAISTASDTTIVVRGLDLTRELLGNVTFTDHYWLLLTGALPSAAGAVWRAGLAGGGRVGEDRPAGG